MNSLQSYFPELNSFQLTKLEEFKEEVLGWNEKINLISRKDSEKIVEHHILPCLVFAHIAPFEPKETILDIGSGGGFPGIVLAICFPKTNFTLIDSIGKKIRATEAIIEKLNLKNVTAKKIRVEELKENFDYVTGRAVTALPKFLDWAQAHLKKAPANSKHGVYYLKGGPLESELKILNILPKETFPLSDFIEGTFYEDKYIVHFATNHLRDVFKKGPRKR